MSKSMASPAPGCAPSPLQFARNTTLNYYELGNALPSVSSVVGCELGPEMSLSPLMRAVVRLCISNSMRISETLAIRRIDECSPSMFAVRGKKKSFSYTVQVPISPINRTALDSFEPQQLLFPCTYHALWAAMVRVGMSLRVTSRVNRIVTHRGRYSVAQKLAELNRREDIQGTLHHRSPKSTQYYLLDESA